MSNLLSRGWRASLVVAAVASLYACATVPGLYATDGVAVTVKLIALNDFHGNLRPPAGTVSLPLAGGAVGQVPLGGAAYLATLVHQLEARNPQYAVVGAGDLISASPLESALLHEESSVEVLDTIGLEWSSVGNHEFDHGTDNLLRIQNGGCAVGGTIDRDTCIGGHYEGARYRYLAANVIDMRTGKPIFPAYGIKRFTTPAGVVPVAFIGLVLRGASELVEHKGIEHLRFADEADTVNALLPELHAQGVHSVIVLIHQGGESTGSFNDHSCPNFTGEITEVVSRLDPSVDAVISAHTHNAYICHLASRDPKQRILVTSAGKYGQFVTDIDLKINPANDKVLSITANNLPVVNDLPGNDAPTAYPALKADPKIAALVAGYKNRAAPLADAVVGWLVSDLKHETDENGESPLGEVIADAQLAATSADAKGGAQMALTNATGVRADLIRKLPGATVNYGQIYTAQPFGNYLVTLTLTGAQIHALLEAQWHPPRKPNMLQPSRAFTYIWNESAPVGQKVDPASMRLHGKPMLAQGLYRVTVNNFLANGGDGFSTFTEASSRTEVRTTDVEALRDYLRQQALLSPPPPGRIQRAE